MEKGFSAIPAETRVGVFIPWKIKEWGLRRVAAWSRSSDSDERRIPGFNPLQEGMGCRD